jgi:hypothetical protein
MRLSVIGLTGVKGSNAFTFIFFAGMRYKDFDPWLDLLTDLFTDLAKIYS